MIAGIRNVPAMIWQATANPTVTAMPKKICEALMAAATTAPRQRTDQIHPPADRRSAATVFRVRRQPAGPPPRPGRPPDRFPGHCGAALRDRSARRPAARQARCPSFG